MTMLKGFWTDGKGFVVLLAIMILTTISLQFSVGVLWAEMLFIRIVFLLFTSIAITSSILPPLSKKVGYGVAISIFLIGIILIRWPDNSLLIIHGVLLTTFMAFIIYLVVLQIFDGGKMTIKKICGGIAVYILIGHLWTSLYLMIYLTDQTTFLSAGSTINQDYALRELSYFSFVTLTTTGYGDITALSASARTFVIFEGFFGQLFPAVFIAKLVSQQIEDARK